MMTMGSVVQRGLMAGVAVAMVGGCIPYTVGSTARTVPPGITERSTSVYVIPSAIESPGDTNVRPLLAIDGEMRRGLDEWTDVGFRLVSASGITATLKRRTDIADGAGDMAWMLGMGLVNVGQHAYGEASLLFSGDHRPLYQPYGGLRLMGVVPIAKEAVWDQPTIGGFFGLRVGDFDLAVMPEIGVFYDRSALKLRSRNWIVAPGISLGRRQSRGNQERR
jgi:hypothetical protein